MADRYIADLSVDKSADRDVWDGDRKTKIDRPCLTDMEKQPKSAWVGRWQEP
jgi:hypothetical protein